MQKPGISAPGIGEGAPPLREGAAQPLRPLMGARNVGLSKPQKNNPPPPWSDPRRGGGRLPPLERPLEQARPAEAIYASITKRWSEVLVDRALGERHIARQALHSEKTQAMIEAHLKEITPAPLMNAEGNGLLRCFSVEIGDVATMNYLLKKLVTAYAAGERLNDIDEKYLSDPFTGEPFDEPVIAASGQTYSRKVFDLRVTRLAYENGQRSEPDPLLDACTRAPLEHDERIDNTRVADYIRLRGLDAKAAPTDA